MNIMLNLLSVRKFTCSVYLAKSLLSWPLGCSMINQISNVSMNQVKLLREAVDDVSVPKLVLSRISSIQSLSVTL